MYEKEFVGIYEKSLTTVLIKFSHTFVICYNWNEIKQQQQQQRQKTEQSVKS